MGMMRKGLFFLIDGILAATLIVSTILVLNLNYVAVDHVFDVDSLSRDSINVLSELKVGELENTTFISGLYADGNITERDENRSVLEMISIFWAEGKDDLAYNMTQQVLDDLIPDTYSYGFYADDSGATSTLFEYNQSDPTDLSTYVKFISGVAFGENVRGTLSKVYIDKIGSKKTSSYFHFGGYVGEGNVSCEIYIQNTTGTEIGQVMMELDVSSDFDLYINDIYVDTFLTSGVAKQADLYILNDSTYNLDTLINSGYNDFSIRFPSGDGYLGGGFIKVTYQTNDQSDVMTEYFDNYTLTKKNLPGIDGIVNLYDSFYVGGTLNSIYIYLDYIADHNGTDNTFYMTIGNNTVYTDSNFSVAHKQVILTDDNFTSLDLNSLSNSTVPLRLGYLNASYVLGEVETNNTGDTAVITDISGSMLENLDTSVATRPPCGYSYYGGYECLYTDNSYDICNDTAINNIFSSRVYIARCIDKSFAYNMTEKSGNRVGLVSYESDVSSGDRVELTTNFSILSAEIEDYEAYGGTCAGCGVWNGIDILNLSEPVGLVDRNSAWKYWDNNTAPGSGWLQLTFDDTSWGTGNAVLGFSSPSVTTEIENPGKIPVPVLWEYSSDKGSDEVDFTSGLNSTGNSFLNQTSSLSLIDNVNFTGPSIDSWSIDGDITLQEGYIGSVVFSDDFEDGTLDQWTIDSNNDGGVVEIDNDPYDGNYNMVFYGDDTATNEMWAEISLDLAGDSDLRLYFMWAEEDLESADHAFLDIYDGSWHYGVKEYGENNNHNNWYDSSPSDYSLETVDLNSYNMIDGFKIRIRCTAQHTEQYDAFLVDDVSVERKKVIFEDDFESGLGNWEIDSNNDGGVVEIDNDPYEGSSNVVFYGDNSAPNNIWIQKELNVIGYSNPTLSFFWAEEDLESADHGYLDIWDGSWHYGVLEFGDNNNHYGYYDTDPSQYNLEVVNLSSYNAVSNLTIRFRSTAVNTEYYDSFLLDYVLVSAEEESGDDPFQMQDYWIVNSSVNTRGIINQSFTIDMQYSPLLWTLTHSTNDSYFNGTNYVFCNLSTSGGEVTIWEESWTDANNPEGPVTESLDISAYVDNTTFTYNLVCGAILNPGTVVAFDDIGLFYDAFDDGWDWATSDLFPNLYGAEDAGQLRDMRTYYDPSGLSGEIEPGMLRIELGGIDGTIGDSYVDSAAFGHHIYINQTVVDMINSGLSLIVSFDYAAEDRETASDRTTEESCYLKARFGNITDMVYLGYHLDNGSGDNTHPKDDTKEILWDWNPSNSDGPWDEDSSRGDYDMDGDGNYSSGTYTEDISNLVDSPGFYFLELGAKFDASGSSAYQGADEGIDAYYDNVELYLMNSSDAYFRKVFNIIDNSFLQDNQVILRVRSEERAKVYLNGYLVYEDNTTNNGEYWNGEVKVPNTRVQLGDNILAAELQNGPSAEFDLELKAIDSRGKAILLMSDGQPNACVYRTDMFSSDSNCNDCSGRGCCPDDSGALNDPCPIVNGFDGLVSGTDRLAAEQAHGMACWASDKYDVGIYTVAYSNDETYKDIMRIIAADCDSEDNFYYSTNASELGDIYDEIMRKMQNGFGTFSKQSMVVSGNFGESRLNPDSFMIINYTVPEDIRPDHDDIFISTNTLTFNSTYTRGSFFYNPDHKLVSAEVSSYSADDWTNFVSLEHDSGYYDVFELARYGHNFNALGDPFLVGIPISFLKANSSNNITIHTGVNGSQMGNGSKDDRVFYTFSIDAYGLSPIISGSAEGCVWNITYFDGTNNMVSIPADYNGSSLCDYATGSYDHNDSIDIAADILLSKLDIDGDGLIDVVMDEDFLETDSAIVENVPALYGPAVTEMRVWK